VEGGSPALENVNPGSAGSPLLKRWTGAAFTSHSTTFFPRKIMRTLNVIRIHLVVALSFALLSSCRKAPEPQFDLIIRNGNVWMARASFGFLRCCRQG
jgi:hypothetical protein